MTPEYEFATTDLTNQLYHFAKTGAKFITEDPKKKAAAAAVAGAPPAPATPPPATPAPQAPPAPAGGAA